MSKKTFTLPVQPNNPGWLGEIEDIWTNVSATHSKRLKGFGGLGLVLQPFPRAFGVATQARGGNSMDLRVTDHDRFVLEIPGVYTNKADDNTVQAWGKDFTDRLTEHLKTSAVGKEYNPFFGNDAGPDQDVLGDVP